MAEVRSRASDEQARQMHAMFARLAPRYDLMNTLMSLGQDRLWRRRAASALDLAEHGLVLDIGTGTGALARAVVEVWPTVQVIGVDVSLAMLRRALANVRNEGVRDRVAWLAADGLRLPFGDGAFDAVTSGFLLRNIADLDRAFAEMARVTRAGGRVVALEFSPEVRLPWGALARGYLGRVAPLLGAIVAGDGPAYRYLPDSIAAFAKPSEVAATMRRCGLSPLRPRRLVFGLVVVHVGVRLAGGDTARDEGGSVKPNAALHRPAWGEQLCLPLDDPGEPMTLRAPPESTAGRASGI